MITQLNHAPYSRERAKVIHQPFEDPPRLAREASSEEEGLTHYRRVRDEIRDYVSSLPNSLEGMKHG